MAWGVAGTGERSLGDHGRRRRTRIVDAVAIPLLAAALIVASGCVRSEPTAIVEHEDVEVQDGPEAYTPIFKSRHPLVDRDWTHTPAPDVSIGPGEGATQYGGEQDGTAADYVSLAASGDPRVDSATPRQPYRPLLLGHERALEGDVQAAAAPEGRDPGSGTPGGTVGSYWTSAARPASAAAASSAAASANAPSPAVGAVTPAGAAVSSSRPSLPSAIGQPAATATPPTRLKLPIGLGAPASLGEDATASDLTVGAEQDVVDLVAGSIESVAGRTLTVRTDDGPRAVLVADAASIEGEARGSVADLRASLLVGVVQRPGERAEMIRVFTPGLGAPPPGSQPLVGARQGQIVTFGTVVSRMHDGLMLRASGTTMPIQVTDDVVVYRPAPATLSALTPGTPIVASGAPGPDDALVASDVRIVADLPVAR